MARRDHGHRCKQRPLESLSELERGFAELMQNVMITGHYTLTFREPRDDQAGTSTGSPEWQRSARIGGEFDVHMTYGSVDMTLPRHQDNPVAAVIPP